MWILWECDNETTYLKEKGKNRENEKINNLIFSKIFSQKLIWENFLATGIKFHGTDELKFFPGYTHGKSTCEK